jgi:hypothetical protein
VKLINVQNCFGKTLNPISLGKLGLVCFTISMIILHFLPSPILQATTLQIIPYDWRLNFMSEFVRTQYGVVMTLNFCLLAATAGMAAWAMALLGYKRESVLLMVTGLSFILLTLFPTDLADLRVDGINCADLTRIEPCTWVGKAHNPLSSVAFLTLALVWLSLAIRRHSNWLKVVIAGFVCLALAVLLVGVSYIYLSHVIEMKRHWFGLMQRSVTVSAMIWLWIVFNQLQTEWKSRLRTDSKLVC